jgi:hypothetical protein
MNEILWIKLTNESIPFLLLLCLGFFLYRGLKKNEAFLSEREDLLKRYLLFRGDKQVRLKIYGEDEKVYRELLKNLSNSWKNFKKTYDQCLLSLAKNTMRTKRLLQLLTLGLLINSARLLIEEYFFYGFASRFFLAVGRELPNYILAALGFLLLRTQTHQYLSPKGSASKVDLETLLFPNGLSVDGEHEGLYNEFDPLEGSDTDEGEMEATSHPKPESRSGMERP